VVVLQYFWHEKESNLGYFGTLYYILHATTHLEGSCDLSPKYIRIIHSVYLCIRMYRTEKNTGATQSILLLLKMSKIICALKFLEY
jgi:hypothetical protein